MFGERTWMHGQGVLFLHRLRTRAQHVQCTRSTIFWWSRINYSSSQTEWSFRLGLGLAQKQFSGSGSTPIFTRHFGHK